MTRAWKFKWTENIKLNSVLNAVWEVTFCVRDSDTCQSSNYQVLLKILIKLVQVFDKDWSWNFDGIVILPWYGRFLWEIWIDPPLACVLLNNLLERITLPFFMKTLCDCDSDPTLFDLEDGETQWRVVLVYYRRISLHLTRNRMSNNGSLQQRKGTRDLIRKCLQIDASPVLCQCDCRVKNERVAHLTPH